MNKVIKEEEFDSEKYEEIIYTLRSMIKCINLIEQNIIQLKLEIQKLRLKVIDNEEKEL